MAGHQERPNSSDPIELFAIPLLILVLFGIIWFSYREGLYYNAGRMAYWMLWPFDFVGGVHAYRLSIVRDIMNAPSLGQVFVWATLAWMCPSLLLAGVCLRTGFKTWKHPIVTMRGPLSVDALMRYQAQVHSPIAPIVPIAMEIHKNNDPRLHEPWHPHEVVEKFGLADEKGDVDRDKAERYFMQQLGTRVYRPGLDPVDTVFADRFNDWEKAIFAMLAPLAVKMKRGMDEYWELCNALNYSAVNPTQTPDLRLANKLYQEYRTHPKLNNLFRVHHFSVTYLMQLYMLAKRAGKVTTSHWVGWLRPNANSLYAALNTAGRQTPFTEASGAYFYWRHEQNAQKKARVPIKPTVVGAVQALVEEYGFWKTAHQHETEETLWGRIGEGGAGDAEIFRRYVTDMMNAAARAPAPGEESLFDVAMAKERQDAEERALAEMMSGVTQSFPKTPQGDGTETGAATAGT